MLFIINKLRSVNRGFIVPKLSDICRFMASAIVFSDTGGGGVPIGGPVPHASMDPPRSFPQKNIKLVSDRFENDCLRKGVV